MDYQGFLSLLKRGQVYTHGGKFHADDVCCTALINLICDHEGIIRPDVERVNTVTPDMQDCLIYDIGRGEFDHHQRENGTHDDGTPYAAFGKIWDVVGEEVSSWYGGGKTHHNFTEAFVKPIDRCDNSAEDNFFSALIRSENPNWNEEGERFDIAVKIAEEGLQERLSHAAELTTPGYVMSTEVDEWFAESEILRAVHDTWAETHPDPKTTKQDLVGMYDARDKEMNTKTAAERQEMRNQGIEDPRLKYARTETERTAHNERMARYDQSTLLAPEEIRRQLDNKDVVHFHGLDLEIVHLEKPNYPGGAMREITKENPQIVGFTVPSRGGYMLMFTGEWKGGKEEGLIAPDRWRGARSFDIPGMTFCHQGGTLMSFSEKETAKDALMVVLEETDPSKFLRIVNAQLPPEVAEQARTEQSILSRTPDLLDQIAKDRGSGTDMTIGNIYNRNGVRTGQTATLPISHIADYLVQKGGYEKGLTRRLQAEPDNQRLLQLTGLILEREYYKDKLFQAKQIYDEHVTSVPETAKEQETVSQPRPLADIAIEEDRKKNGTDKRQQETARQRQETETQQRQERENNERAEQSARQERERKEREYREREAAERKKEQDRELHHEKNHRDRFFLHRAAMLVAAAAAAGATRLGPIQQQGIEK